jgi:hypothetical protein
MFGFLKKEEFISLGVNCDADFSNLSSITIALDFHELLITKAFLKDDILGLQKQSDEHNLGLRICQMILFGYPLKMALNL